LLCSILIYYILYFFIDLDTEECTYIVSGQRCLQVLGFVKATSTQRSFLMDGGSYIFRPHKVNQNIVNWYLLFLLY